MKLTVKEYSQEVGISAQAVYQKLQNGTLKYTVEDGKKYIISDNNSSVVVKPLKQLQTSSNSHYIENLEKTNKLQNKKIKQLEKKIEKKDKQLEKLHKQLVQSIQAEKQVLVTFITEQKKLLEYQRDDTPLDIKPIKKRKKKKRN